MAAMDVVLLGTGSPLPNADRDTIAGYARRAQYPGLTDGGSIPPASRNNGDSGRRRD